MWEKLLPMLLLAPEVAPPEVEKTLTFVPEPISFQIEYSQLPSDLTSLCIQSSGSRLTLNPSTSPSPDCLAYGSFQETLFETGWSQLSLVFDSSIPSSYAAGLIEGLLTSTAIDAQVKNLRKIYEYGDLQALYRYYAEVEEVVVELIAEKQGDGEDKDFWDEVLSTRAHLEGLLDACDLLGLPITLEDLYFINTDGDIDNLFLLTSDPFTRLSNTFLSRVSHSDRCSALVKLTPTEVFFGHTTMEDYGEMNRILKSYTVDGNTVRMSSYPGAISSTDDFLLSSHGLAVMETSLPLDGGILKGGKNGLPAFYRIQAAIRTAKTPLEFINTLRRYDSFTYFSQWMVLDYNQVAIRPLKEAFFVLETAPKYAKFEDLSDYLEENSYWASYNWPYFPETCLALGLQESSFQRDIRKDQFAALQKDVTSVEDMMKVMQFNSWKDGECEKGNALQPCSPEGAISPRFDLGREGTMFGGTDSKVTSRELMSDLSMYAISGPTHESQPAFSFPSPNPFLYIPSTWSFDWVLYPSNPL